jgi:hypothetical protein
MKTYIDAEIISEISRVLLLMNIVTFKEDVILISTFDNSGGFGVHTWYSLISELLTIGEMG